MRLEIVEGPHLRDRDGYFAGSDEARAGDLNLLLRDPSIGAIWLARGGYGASRILDRVDWRAARGRPRILVGYSDATALFAAGARRGAPWSSLYGPVVTEIADPALWHRPTLLALLDGAPIEVPIPRRGVLAEGRARGPLAGGNLTVLTHLLGTPHMPRLRGAVLFLEDVGEETYRLDRSLVHLRQSGALDGVRGVILGAFDPPPTRRTFPPDRPFREVVRETFGDLGIPVVSGLRAGHVPAKRTLPLGGEVRLDTRRGTIRIRPWSPEG